MFCPQCKAEYRPGFTRCADCDVELVQELHATKNGFGSPSEEAESAADSDDPICSFWQGDDPRIHAEICELLNEEGIPHRTIRREDHLFNLNSKSGFQIGIPFSQFEKAEAAIKNAYGTELVQTDAARLLPYGKGYAPAVRGVMLWKGVLKGFGWEQDAHREDTEITGGIGIGRVRRRPSTGVPAFGLGPYGLESGGRQSSSVVGRSILRRTDH